MEPDRKRKEELIKKGESFRGNALKIIKKMLDLCNLTPGSKPLVDEILHSIFFLGKINLPPFSPESIIDDAEMFEALRAQYPRPFDLFSTQLPRRSPFSCVLDMIVLQKGQASEDRILQSLQDFTEGLEPSVLVSSTICVSQKSNNAVRHYGASMSTSGPNAGRIVIAASCLSFWDSYVAGAVITYYPVKAKKAYFDGTIKLPNYVRCQAFNLSQSRQMPACRSCGNLFGLGTTEIKEWPYGNCAEPECVSKLLAHEADVKEQSRPTSETCTEENKKKARESVLTELKKTLRMVQFGAWDNTFYIPIA